MDVLRRRRTDAYLAREGVYQIGVRVVLRDGREAVWDTDVTAGLEAQVMRDGILVGFVPCIEGSGDFDVDQTVDAIVRADYDQPIARERHTVPPPVRPAAPGGRHVPPLPRRLPGALSSDQSGNRAQHAHPHQALAQPLTFPASSSCPADGPGLLQPPSPGRLRCAAVGGHSASQECQRTAAPHMRGRSTQLRVIEPSCASRRALSVKRERTRRVLSMDGSGIRSCECGRT